VRKVNSEVIYRLIVFSLGAVFTLTEVVAWWHRRHKVAFKIGLLGIWTQQTDWLSWPDIELKIDRWRDVLSLSYQTTQSFQLAKWTLSNLAINSRELLQLTNKLSSVQ
jgi:hypothetical protein